jgi:hypothetical protein
MWKNPCLVGNAAILEHSQMWNTSLYQKLEGKPLFLNDLAEKV